MSAVVHHNDTGQTASERERGWGSWRHDAGWHHSPPSLRLAWLADASAWESAAPSPPEADFTRFSFSVRRTTQTNRKEKKSSWFSRAGAFRQWEQLGQTIIFSAQSGLPQITTGIITLLPPQRLGAPNGNLWWCVGNPSLLKIPECCVFDRNTSPLLVCFLSGEAQSVLLKCHYVLTSKHIIFTLPFYSMLYQGKKFPVTALVWNLDLEMYIPVIVLLHLPLDTVNTIKMHLTTNLFFNFPSDWVKNWHVIIFLA